jgi:predicted Zn-dependent protease
MKQLGEAAQHGRFLRPFAKLMLALANLREKQSGPARELLQQLATEFPQNVLFQRELDKIKSHASSVH